ncbi:hypothetical protein N9T80_00215, partial [bacterium]|nr:hypothetical protein [bacterium]
NISFVYNNQISYDKFKSEYNTFSSEILNTIKYQNLYLEISKNFTNIFDLDTNTTVSIIKLKKRILENNNEISSLKTIISKNKDNKVNAKNIIVSTVKQRNTYTETIGADMIIKVRNKAAIKSEKGKILKGRKGVIWSIVNSQDSTEEVNKKIISVCKKNIDDAENEVLAREMMLLIIEKNIQVLNDLLTMQNLHLSINNIKSNNFNDLVSYIINEDIKVITTLKKGRYIVPTLPNKWKQAQLKADYLVEQNINNETLQIIKERYTNSGGQWRDLTTEEGYARQLITTVVKPVEEVIFDQIYMKNRVIKLDLDSITYIPYRDIQYTFSAKEIRPNLMEQAKGEIDKYFFMISASYDDLFFGMDNEEKVLRKYNERENIQVGSLEKNITNGNWGE